MRTTRLIPNSLLDKSGLPKVPFRSFSQDSYEALFLIVTSIQTIFSPRATANDISIQNVDSIQKVVSSKCTPIRWFSIAFARFLELN